MITRADVWSSTTKRRGDNRLRSEYVTLLVIAASFKGSDHNVQSPEEIWYTLLTTEKYIKPCMNLNEFALRFLTRTLNECVVK